MGLYRKKIGWGIVAVLTACSGWAQDAREDMFLDSYEVICMLGHVLALEPDPAEKNHSFGIQTDGSIRSDPSIETFLKETGGVAFPEGSFAYYLESVHKLFVYNTAENHARTKACLDSISLPNQIEIDFMLINMPLEAVEQYARQHGAAVPGSRVVDWFREGRGRLVSSAKVVTRNGVNAQVQCVREVIYASEYDSTVPQHVETEATPRAGILYPTAFETREAGTIFNVTPTLSPDRSMIELTLVPEYCTLDGVDEQSVETPAGEEESGDVSWTQPRFHSANIATSAILRDGETRVLGGALRVEDEDEMLFMVLTARLIRPEPSAD